MHLLSLAVLAASLWGATSAPDGFSGHWVVDPAGTSAIDPWRSISLDVTVDDGRVVLVRHMSWGARAATDSVNVPTNGQPSSVPFTQWLDNRHLGVWAAGDGTKQVTAQWVDGGRTLQLVSTMTVSTSQGEQPMRIHSEYRLSPSGNRLTLIELRSSRDRPVVYAFVRPS